MQGDVPSVGRARNEGLPPLGSAGRRERPTSELPRYTDIFATAFLGLLDRVLDGRRHEADILNTPENEHDAQSAVDLLQDALQSESYIPHRQRIHRILMKLSLKYQTLPASLFLHGVQRSHSESHGSGSFADIYLGEFKGRPVALKRLRVFQMLDASKRVQLQRAFYHESLIWRVLHHPHVLPFLGIDDTSFEFSLCMVLPWMSHGNIRHAIDRLRSTSIPHDMNHQTVKWMHEITAGLVYLHGEGIVHGDLRGANILVDSDKSCKLTDFGMSVFSEGTSHNYGSARGGNARWMAPEMIDPEAFGLTSERPAMESDVFSLGCVCVELCTSAVPYAGVSDLQVVVRVPQGLRPSRPTFYDATPLPDELWLLVTRCWAYPASERPQGSRLVDEMQRIGAELSWQYIVRGDYGVMQPIKSERATPAFTPPISGSFATREEGHQTTVLLAAELVSPDNYLSSTRPQMPRQSASAYAQYLPEEHRHHPPADPSYAPATSLYSSISEDLGREMALYTPSFWENLMPGYSWPQHDELSALAAPNTSE